MVRGDGTFVTDASVPRLRSMTGYARSSGDAEGATWAWEIKTVNAKGFELRLRLPPGFDALEADARAGIAARIRRGTVQAVLVLHRAKPAQTVRVHTDRLAALATALAEMVLPGGIAPATLDGLLALPGIVEVQEVAENSDRDAALRDRLLADLDVALDGCIAMRGREGEGIGTLLAARLSAMARLVSQAEDAPGRRPEAIRAKLAARIAELGAAAPALDPVRLHQEAVLIAARADVREEIDRLGLHRAAAATLLAEGGPVGRRLDFLAQELAREATTLCAKSNDAALTVIGLDLRTEIEQFREQVQNLE